MKKASVSFFVFLVIALTQQKSFGQSPVPGLMGRRFSLNYGLHFSPTLRDGGLDYSPVNFAGTKIGGLPGGSFFFNKWHKLQVEYILSRRLSINLDVDYFRAGCRPLDIVGGSVTILKITGIGTGIELKHYFMMKTGTIAPIGTYINYGVTHYFSSSWRSTVLDRTSDNVFVTQQFLRFWGGGGFTKAISERILFGMGGTFGFKVNLNSEKYIDPNSPGRYTASRVSVMRVGRMMGVNGEAHIGFLLF